VVTTERPTEDKREPRREQLARLRALQAALGSPGNVRAAIAKRPPNLRPYTLVSCGLEASRPPLLATPVLAPPLSRGSHREADVGQANPCGGSSHYACGHYEPLRCSLC